VYAQTAAGAGLDGFVVMAGLAARCALSSRVAVATGRFRGLDWAAFWRLNGAHGSSSGSRFGNSIAKRKLIKVWGVVVFGR
jgi:hypothetical protein